MMDRINEIPESVRCERRAVITHTARFSLSALRIWSC